MGEFPEPARMAHRSGNPPTPLPADRSGWSERGLGRRPWQHQFFHVLIRLLGRRPAYHMVYIVTLWYVLFRRTIRQRAHPYLSRRFPGTNALARLFCCWRLVWNFGKTLVDLATLRILGEDSLAITSPDHDRITQLCDSPRGLILLHAHVGCWQVGISALRHMRKPISLLMVPEPRMQEFISRYPLNVIDARKGLEAVVEMTAVLQRGEILCIMGDRLFGEQQHTVAARFLDDQVNLPISPYRLASATKTPIVVLAVPRTGIGCYELRLANVIDVPSGLGRRPLDYAPYAQQFADCLDAFVQNYPWQYFNFFDLWSASPA